jgi:hypothetical protein
VLAVASVVIAFTTVLGLNSPKRAVNASRPAVLVADWTNQTGDPAFNTPL